MSSRLLPLVGLIATSVLFTATSSSWAQPAFTITDGDSLVEFYSSAPSDPDYTGPRFSGFEASPPEPSFTSSGSWWWYAQAGGTREHAFNPLSWNASGNTATLTQSDLVPGLDAQLNIKLIDDPIGPDTMQFRQTMILTNTTGTDITGFQLFQFNDIDEFDYTTFDAHEEFDLLALDHVLFTSARTTDTIHLHQPGADGHFYGDFPLGVQILEDGSLNAQNNLSSTIGAHYGPADIQVFAGYLDITVAAGSSVSISTSTSANGFVAVPEPGFSGLGLLGLGLASLIRIRRRRGSTFRPIKNADVLA